MCPIFFPILFWNLYVFHFFSILLHSLNVSFTKNMLREIIYLEHGVFIWWLMDGMFLRTSSVEAAFCIWRVHDFRSWEHETSLNKDCRT
jgi:hypothetical protein